MGDFTFEWDDQKARINIDKHGITFEEASSVFDDERAVLFDDPEHSDNEERFLLLGISRQASLEVPGGRRPMLSISMGN